LLSNFIKALSGKKLKFSALPDFDEDSRVSLHDGRRCNLGEGIFWHPTRKQLFWFDISEKKLLTRDNEKPLEWQFDEHVSAAGWIDKNRLLIASESRLFSFNLDTSETTIVCELEASISGNRSNDGRADPWGGFWISTMGKLAEQKAGSIYRFYNGQLRRLHKGVTIPNSICFSPDGMYAYFSDTSRQKIFKQFLTNFDGWPLGEAEVFVDFSSENINPDGAIVDKDGNFWCAFWGSSQLICLSSDGGVVQRVNVPAKQPSCVAFGNDDFKSLYFTSACQGLNAISEVDGQTFKFNSDFSGLPEPRVIL
jgi:sugar lactone lactonase YvrE